MKLGPRPQSTYYKALKSKSRVHITIFIAARLRIMQITTGYTRVLRKLSLPEFDFILKQCLNFAFVRRSNLFIMTPILYVNYEIVVGVFDRFVTTGKLSIS